MKIVFIRHGEPDYKPCDDRGFRGQGRDLAGLTENGIMQAEQVSKLDLLKGASFIVSSPYTRALQTAAIISKNTGLNIRIETDLHEFILDKQFMFSGEEESVRIHKDFLACKGNYPKSEAMFHSWETIDEIIQRIVPVMNRYLNEEKIIVVAHGGVIRRFIKKYDINHCSAFEIEYDENFKCFNWID